MSPSAGLRPNDNLHHNQVARAAPAEAIDDMSKPFQEQRAIPIIAARCLVEHYHDW